MRPLPRSARSERPERRNRGVRRAVVLMPNGLTLFNLFCGIYAIVLAARKEIASAPSFIVLGGIADTLDGRVARATGTGSRFGEELDSLVDAVTFGFAPAFIMYLASPEPHMALEWLLVFIFTSCAVMRLARFNVEQAGRSKSHFHGLPSPAAGLTLASYYWFRETPLYNQTVILFTDSTTLKDLPWAVLLRGLMAVLAALMISDVPYPTMPSIGFRSPKKLFGTLVIVGCVYLLVVRREEFIFPAMLAYVLFGAIKWVVIGFLGKSATPDEIYGARTPLRDPDREERRPATGRTPPLGAPATAPELRRADRREDGREDGREPTLEDRGGETRAGGSRRKRRRRGRGQRPPGSAPSGPSSPDSPTGPAE
ncbi:MAG: CDP-diacylglycerol--serine O-phosphatidyltransferase [Gemmatimonadaceae bacterium]